MRSVQARDRSKRSEDRSKSRHRVKRVELRDIDGAIASSLVQKHPWLWSLFDGVSSSLALRFPNVSADMAGSINANGISESIV